MKDTYTESWYASHDRNTRHSAEVIAKLLMEWISPKSAVDVGCGVGTWLSALSGMGVEEIMGVDGPWVDPKLLEIKREQFLPVDLKQGIQLGRSFDLVLCLEVAEHLEPESADPFVKSLVGLGPAILFSAAIPFQGGLHHANERWPRYWVDRFETCGYVAVDCIRRRIWEDPQVLVHYRQNMLLFVAGRLLRENPALASEHAASRGWPLDVVHPELYTIRVESYRDLKMRSFSRIVKALPGLFLAALRRRLSRDGLEGGSSSDPL